MEIEEIIEAKLENIPQQKSKLVLDQFEMKKLKIKVLKQLFRITKEKTGGTFKTLNLIYQIREKYQSTFGEPLLTKATFVDNRYYWRLGAPGFPSKASVKMHENEVSRFMPSLPRVGLRTLLFAITKKCPLNCEHCFEWDNLNQKEQLSSTEIIQIIHKYQDFGTTQIMLSGGEPMLRVNDIYKILEAAKPGTDFWIITSGLGLSLERAKKLKASGLTGVMVSLDHFEATKHNQFRGSDGAFSWAIEAVINANKVGLVTTLSLCTTKSFATKNNFTVYMDLAKKLGVSFVQFVEPRATGRYKGKDVELGKEEIDLLEETYLKYNASKEFKDYPIINYLGYHQRRAGCFGGGDRFFYIDTDGDAHLCPFCTNKVASALHFSANDIVDLLSKNTCFDFSKNTIEKTAL